MFFVGIGVILVSLIGTANSGLGVFLGFILGAFCLLVGYYGSDVKKGMEELKHDIMEVKDVATAAVEKTAEVAKSSVEKVEDMANKKAPEKKVGGKK